jgi:hypothetical protein
MLGRLGRSDLFAVMALSAAMMTAELGGHVNSLPLRRREPEPAEDNPGREERVARIKAEAEARRQRRRGRRASTATSQAELTAL